MGRGLRILMGVTAVLATLSLWHGFWHRADRIDVGSTVRLTRMASIAWGVSRFESRFRRYDSDRSQLYPELSAPDRLRFVCTLHPNNRHVRRRSIQP